mmetsp:Transcript_1417/g.2596  ORF Transcript_1417/g.2596 Transcript_1417/m.2596 type:complete len:215 (-) Transcript_1417:211-855(-)
MSRFIRGSLITINQLPHSCQGRFLPSRLTHMRKRHGGTFARLNIARIPIDRPSVQSRRRPCLETSQRKAKPLECQRQSDRGGFDLLGIAQVPSAGITIVSNHENAAEKCAGGENYRGGFDFETFLRGCVDGYHSADACAAMVDVGLGRGKRLCLLESHPLVLIAAVLLERAVHIRRIRQRGQGLDPLSLVEQQILRGRFQDLQILHPIILHVEQ